MSPTSLQHLLPAGRSLEDLLLSGDVSPALDSLIARFANQASRKNAPGRSVALLVRRHFPALPPAAAAVLRDLVKVQLRALEQRAEWLSEGEAARILKCTSVALTDALRDPEFRKRLGSPVRVGGSWRFPPGPLRNDALSDGSRPGAAEDAVDSS